MKPTRSLFFKGVLLVGIPMLVQFAVIGALLIQMQQVDKETMMELQARTIVDSSNRVMEICTDVIYGLWSFVETRDKSGLRKVREGLAAMPVAREDLKNSMNAVGVEAKEYDKVSPTLDFLADGFGSLHHTLTEGTIFEKLKAYSRFTNPDVRKELTRRLEDLAEGMKAIIRRSDEINVSSPDRQLAIQRRMEIISLGGCVLSILLSLGLAAYFAKNINGRLQTMTDNASRLAKGKMLNPALQQSDEISEVDAVFHRMAATLTEAMKREAALIDNSHEVICSLDLEGRFVRVNNAVEEQWGFAAGELIGKPLIDLLPEFEHLSVSRMLLQIRAEATLDKFETKVIKNSGEHIDALFSICWSEFENTLFCVVHDVTERKQNEQLKQDFLAMISHDLRTPLASVLLAQELLVEGVYGQLSPLAIEKLEMSNRNVDRLVKLVNDLLDLEKLEAGQMQLANTQCDVAGIVSRSFNAVESFADEQRVKLISEHEDQTLFADGDRLEQVLINLVSNAVRFSPPDSEVKVVVTARGDELEFVVEDRGSGVPEAYRASIFERFKQIEERGHQKTGTGLGLAICKLIVDSHHGSIGVESEDGKGSRFWFRIPVVRKSEAATAAPEILDAVVQA